MRCRPRLLPAMPAQAPPRTPTGGASPGSTMEPSPVVELNRAVAHGMAFGPAAGLELVDELVTERSLKDYPFLPAVRGNLLEKLGRSDEARAEFEHAAELTRNAPQREQLLERARACADASSDLREGAA
jgi:predicted RNA polymerase sigma factor